MNFTLFLNSRGRVEQLKKFIATAELMTSNHKATQMIITGDDDDLETVEFLKTVHERGTFSFHTITGPRPTSLCASFNNMAMKAEGRYLFVLNDDAEILTPNWDTIALNKILEFKHNARCKDDIIYGSTSDTSVDKVAGQKYASFPIISAQAVQTLGFFMYEQFVGLGGDSSIYRVYDAVDRVVDMSEIVVDHVYHNNIFRVISPDKTAHEMRMNSSSHNIDPFTFDISADVTRLQDFLNSKNA